MQNKKPSILDRGISNEKLNKLTINSVLNEKMNPNEVILDIKDVKDTIKAKDNIKIVKSTKSIHSVTDTSIATNSVLIDSLYLIDNYVTKPTNNTKLASLAEELKTSMNKTSVFYKFQCRFEALFSILDKAILISRYPFIIMAPDCTIVLVSPAINDLLGFESSELVGSNINMLMDDALAARHDKIIRDYCERVSSGEEEKNSSTVVNSTRPAIARHKNGHNVSIEISVKTILAHDESLNKDEVVLFIGQLKDCTDEISLKHSIKEAQTLQSVFPFPYLESSECGIITKFNPSAERAFGVSAQRAIGKNVIILMPNHITSITNKKRIPRNNHIRIVENFVSKVRAVGIDNVKSNVVNTKTTHDAIRSNNSDKESLKPETFLIELEVKIQLSYDNTIKFQAFIRDMSSFINQQEARSAVITSQAFPQPIVNELHLGKNINGERDISIIFCDIVGFTSIASMLQDQVVLKMLGDIFGMFRNIKKSIPSFDTIKTNYDEFMATTGLDFNMTVNHADAAIESAFAMLQCIIDYNIEQSMEISIRIGISSGLTMCGIIGGEQGTFDIIGNTSVLASRAEGTCDPNKIHITQSTYDMLSPKSRQLFKKRSLLTHFKNIGELVTYISL